MSSIESAPSEKQWLAGIGVVLLAVAGVFLWGELAIATEWVLVVLTVGLAGLGLVGLPRSQPQAGMLGLVACALAAAGWFGSSAYLGIGVAATARPLPLLLTLGLALVAGVGIAVSRYPRAAAELDRRHAAMIVYPMVALGLLASAALYYQLFTIGFAEENVARRLVLTLAWLVAGVALVIVSQPKADRQLRNAGFVFVGVAVAKALVYDTTHLDGALRVATLALAGLLLVGGSWVLGLRAKRPTEAKTGELL